MTYLTQNGPLQVQPGLAVPQRGESVDDTSAWHGARAQNEHVGARHLLLLWRQQLAESGQGISPGVRQVGRSANVASDTSSQPQHASNGGSLASVSTWVHFSYRHFFFFFSLKSSANAMRMEMTFVSFPSSEWTAVFYLMLFPSFFFLAKYISVGRLFETECFHLLQYIYFSLTLNLLCIVKYIIY